MNEDNEQFLKFIEFLYFSKYNSIPIKNYGRYKDISAEFTFYHAPKIGPQLNLRGKWIYFLLKHDIECVDLLK